MMIKRSNRLSTKVSYLYRYFYEEMFENHEIDLMIEISLNAVGYMEKRE